MWDKVSMRQSIRDIYQTFLNDEELLRLLYYPPENLAENRPNPLDESLPNILDMDLDKLWSIRDDTILLTSKTDDLDVEPKCRLLFYAGRRTPTHNYLVADQTIVCDILCHFDYERDQRSRWISGRVNELIVRSRVTGRGEVDYVRGEPISDAKKYIRERHTYE